MPIRPTHWIIAACLLSLLLPADALSQFPKRTKGPWNVAVRSRCDPDARTIVAPTDLPVCFEQNLGQTDDRVSFFARASGYSAFLTPDDLVLSLHDSPSSVVRMRISGASRSTPVGELALETRTNYFVGDDPARWRTDVPNFARVRYPSVRPGVDLVCYGNGSRLEYDLVVEPGVDPSTIELEWEGVDSLDVDADGALVMRVGRGELRQLPPSFYQRGGAEEREPVAGAFAVVGHGRVAIRTGAYDPSRPLVVDPVIAYSTYVGGSRFELATAVAVDAAGAAYLTGITGSHDFPLANPYDSTAVSDSQNAFVTKVSPTGNSIVYSTYFGGETAFDQGNAIAVDRHGAAYVAGKTGAFDFPAVGAYDSTIGGDVDAFVAKLGPSGGTLVYSTLLGGSGDDEVADIAVGLTGPYVVGLTESANFPTENAYDSTAGGGDGDGFVAKLSFDDSMPGSSLTLDYSTFLGGSGYDAAARLAVDAAGAAVVAGTTLSTDFPTRLAHDATHNGAGDVFVACLSRSGGTLVFSTYLGGNDTDSPRGIAIGPNGDLFVAGRTESANFPTARAVDSTFNGNEDSFVTRLTTPTTTTPIGVVYSTFVGGSGNDQISDVAVDAAGAAWVAGTTTSANFPAVAATDSKRGGRQDAFVTKVAPAGTSLLFSTYLGGNGAEEAWSIALDAAGAAYVTGWTKSKNFPTVSAGDSTFNGGLGDVFVAKFR